MWSQDEIQKLMMILEVVDRVGWKQQRPTKRLYRMDGGEDKRSLAGTRSETEGREGRQVRHGRNLSWSY
jgi:hypothetical protein